MHLLSIQYCDIFCEEYDIQECYQPFHTAQIKICLNEIKANLSTLVKTNFHSVPLVCPYPRM